MGSSPISGLCRARDVPRAKTSSVIRFYVRTVCRRLHNFGFCGVSIRDKLILTVCHCSRPYMGIQIVEHQIDILGAHEKHDVMSPRRRHDLRRQQHSRRQTARQQFVPLDSHIISAVTCQRLNPPLFVRNIAVCRFKTICRLTVSAVRPCDPFAGCSAGANSLLNLAILRIPRAKLRVPDRT